MFYRGEDKHIIYHFSGNFTRVLGDLPAGYYHFTPPNGQSPLTFQNLQLTNEPIVDLDTEAYQRVLKYTQAFFAPGTYERANRYNIPHFLGILMHGRPGTGKTTIIKRLVRELIGQGVTALEMDHNSYPINQFNIALTTIRNAEEEAFEAKLTKKQLLDGNYTVPRRPLLLLLEEVEEAIKTEEAAVKRFLDILQYHDNVAVLATTNYIDQIPPSFTDRPGRFAHVVEVGTFNAEQRRTYINHLLDTMKVPKRDRARIDIEVIVEATEGQTADHISTILTDVLVYGAENSFHFAQAVKTLQDKNTKILTRAERSLEQSAKLREKIKRTRLMTADKTIPETTAAGS